MADPTGRTEGTDSSVPSLRSETDHHETIPDDFPVVPVDPNTYEGGQVATCGHCHISWDDSISTAWTPVPSGRCPFEYQHKYEDDYLYGITYGNGETRIGATGYVFASVWSARVEAVRVMQEGWDAATAKTDLPDAHGFPMETPIFAADIETADSHIGTVFPDGRWVAHTDEDDSEDAGRSGLVEWEMLVRHVNALDYEDAVNLWNECDEFQSHITNMWADEAERHAERLAEEGSFYR